MKKTGLFVLLLATAAWAQSGTEASADPQGTAPSTVSFPTLRIQTPTYADLYCAGFISKQILPDANYVAGGLQTPSTTKFTRGDMVYLQGGGYTAGAEYEIVRALKDINEYEMYPGEKKLLKETGQPYEEVGRVKIIDTRNKTAIGQVEYSCDAVNPGDTTIPFAEKQAVAFHAPARFDRYLPSSNKLSGRIVMGKDFDSQLGTGQKVYLNVGSNQGVKIGDFFRAVRSYEADLKDPVDYLSLKAAIAEAFRRSRHVHQGQRSCDSRARSAAARRWRNRHHRRHQYDRHWNDRVCLGRCALWRRRGSRPDAIEVHCRVEAQCEAGDG